MKHKVKFSSAAKRNCSRGQYLRMSDWKEGLKISKKKRGEKSNWATITNQQAIGISKTLGNAKLVAHRFKTTTSIVYKIRSGMRWCNITGIKPSVNNNRKYYD